MIRLETNTEEARENIKRKINKIESNTPWTMIILGNGGNVPDLSGIGHFFETWFGRPCCIVCGWNPGFYQPPEYVNENLEGENHLDKGGGYADNYPSDCWKKHVLLRHKELLSGKDFKRWAELQRGGFKHHVAKQVYKIKASDLDVILKK